MGKTSIMLTVFNILKEKGLVNRMLVVAPRLIIYDAWPEELKAWAHLEGLTYTTIHGNNWRDKLQEDSDIYLTTIDLAASIFEAKTPKKGRTTINPYFAKNKGIDMLVIDELSKFKAYSANRTKAMVQISKLFPRVYGLTGSISPNNLIDLFSQALIVCGEAPFGKYITHYKYEYFNQIPTYGSKYMQLYAKKDSYDRINAKLSPYCKTYNIKECLDMPDRVVKIITVDMPEKACEVYAEMEKKLITEFNGNIITTKNATTKLLSLRQMANGGIYRYNATHRDGIDEVVRVSEVLHHAKTEALEELLESLNGEPTLVIYHFQHDKERIKEKLGDIPDLSDANGGKFNELLTQWNAGNIPVLLGQPQSVGHGLNLQKGGNNICFYSIDWSFDNHSQAIGRLYRQGQEKETVFIYYILTRNTIDSVVYQSLIEKNTHQEKVYDLLKNYVKGLTS